MTTQDDNQARMKFSYYLPCHFNDRSKPAVELYQEAEYQAQYAEELGFDSIAIPEHYFMNYISCPSILLFAVKLSQLVSLRIVSAVIPLPYYHPLRLAQEIALADVLTGGRLELGIGRGTYDFEFDRLQISKDQILKNFFSKEYFCYMTGFIAGMPFLGDIDQNIRLKRLETPRVKVPKGSVGITEKFCNIYTFESPGGWNIIGNSPIKVFDKLNNINPALINPGDTVSFYKINYKEYKNWNE